VKGDFCFAYFDLSIIKSISSAEEKWKNLFYIFMRELPGAWEDVEPTQECYCIKMRAALQNLGKYDKDMKWIITLDEFQFLLSGLSDNESTTMADQIQLFLLDNESPCHFVLSGGTQGF
jgi:hypothetical protein